MRSGLGTRGYMRLRLHIDKIPPLAAHKPAFSTLALDSASNHQPLVRISSQPSGATPKVCLHPTATFPSAATKGSLGSITSVRTIANASAQGQRANLLDPDQLLQGKKFCSRAGSADLLP